jgi:hypothetical protein
MTERRHTAPTIKTVRTAVAGVIVAGGALAMAGQAAADPAPPCTSPTQAGPCAPPPGQPVLDPTAGALAAPPPPPGGPPTVPEIQNPQYGAGQTPGQLGYLRDIWHTFHSGNPMEALTAPMEEAPGAPPGAGPAPQLPPGYVSISDPASNGPPPKGPNIGGPALPPGYYPLNGPPPPGYFDPPPIPVADPGTPPPILPPTP